MTTPTMPTNQDFATEVRTDRLGLLWKVTLIIFVNALWLLFSFGALQRVDLGRPGLVFLSVIFGCLGARFFLHRNRFRFAVWVYALGGTIGIGIVLAGLDPVALQLVPFVFPVIVFIVGLLISPSATFVLAVISSAVIIIVPYLAQGNMDFLGVHQIFAVILTFVSATLAALSSGELFAVTEWALANYQKERKTTQALFDNRQLLERTLLRTQALSEQLQETNQQLEFARAAAEEAKHYRGQFLANMSHELRTPLNAIIGFSETMLSFPSMYDGVGLPNAYQSDLGQIHSSGRQLLSLINDILDLSRVDAGKLDMRSERVQIEPVVKMVLATAAGLVSSKPVNLEKDIADDLPDLLADEARVRQVLLNLYSNAAKFTDSGSITLIIRPDGDGVRLSVKDTGAGIDPKNHGLIFEEFKQAESIGRDPRSGAGLGLAISRQLLTLMDGRIWVESEVGKGSTFHIWLPRYPDALDTKPRPLLIPNPTAQKSEG
ncbi:MAG: HAMP domain-containing histidine kinase [Anaerolineaceae bacterium]|nr:HAMP domain-containing histidine kinase [Anaerolineaceae bacterium]